MSKNVIDKGFRISPKYYQKDWNDLVLDKKDSPDWDKAIKIFRDRMDGRWLKQIDYLDKNPNRKLGVFSGFAIMALVCLFIETLEQFFRGNKRTGQGMDVKAFYGFFQRSLTFNMFFDSEDKTLIFYNHIRCGLLHQAETKEKSTIHIRNEKMLQWVNPNKINEGIKIQRRLFHQEVLNIYEEYINRLRVDFNLRRKFDRKMYYIVNRKKK